MTNRASLFLFAALLLACATFAHAQVQVAIAPNPHPQFLDSAGKPLSGGFLYTYQAGTTTLQNTYIDSTGTVQNPDPIPLDVTGAPSNGSTQTGIWLANQAYKFCAYNAALVQQWCADNVTGYLNLLNLANTWTFAQTFSAAITDTLIDNQLVFGAPGTTTTLDFPPPLSPVVLGFPNTSTTMVGRNTTDTLTNKTINNPTINGVSVTGAPVFVLFKNTVAVTHTGTTTLDTIYTIPIPVLSANSTLRITVSYKATTQGAAGTTVGMSLGGTNIATLGNYAASFNGVGIQSIITISNRNSVSAQLIDTANNYPQTVAAGPVINSFGITSAINTGVTTNLVVTAQDGANSDAQSFNSILVELL